MKRIATTWRWNPGNDVAQRRGNLALPARAGGAVATSPDIKIRGPEDDTGVGPLQTPDGRYIIVRGRLWRAANPNLSVEEREALVRALMAARRAVRAAQVDGDTAGLSAARAAVDAAKTALGERGPVWWQDGAEDFNRHLVRNTPYRAWYAQIAGSKT